MKKLLLALMLMVGVCEAGVQWYEELKSTSIDSVKYSYTFNTFKHYRVYASRNWVVKYTNTSSVKCTTGNGYRDKRCIVKGIGNNGGIDTTLIKCSSKLYNFIIIDL